MAHEAIANNIIGLDGSRANVVNMQHTGT